MKITRNWIKKNFGEKCQEYEDGCCVCRVWLLFEQLEQYYKLVE